MSSVSTPPSGTGRDPRITGNDYNAKNLARGSRITARARAQGFRFGPDAVQARYCACRDSSRSWADPDKIARWFIWRELPKARRRLNPQCETCANEDHSAALTATLLWAIGACRSAGWWAFFLLLATYDLGTSAWFVVNGPSTEYAEARGRLRLLRSLSSGRCTGSPSDKSCSKFRYPMPICVVHHCREKSSSRRTISSSPR